MKNNSRFAAPAMALSMLIFGSIGLIRNLIPLPSGAVAMLRGLIGALCLVPFLFRDRRGFIELISDRKALFISLLTGVLLGVNWILLFEAYRYTTVAVATLSYYMAPVIVIAVTPILTHTRLTVKQAVCTVAAVCGMVAVSGVITANPGEIGWKGILPGLAAACLYASIVLINRFFPSPDPFAGTVIRLGMAGIALIPYVCLAETVTLSDITLKTVLLLAVIGVVHTGLAYYLYFKAVGLLPSLTTALMSYIDPAVAVLLSAFVLKEPFTPLSAVGTVLMLEAVILLELPGREKRCIKKT